MDFNKLTMGKPAFINFTANLLREGMATLLPKNQVVIEILEDVEPDPEVVAACKSLKEKGYQIALDDFVFRPDYRSLIQLAEILQELPIEVPVKNALLGQPNGYRYLLELIIAYEQGNWSVVNRLLNKFSIKEECVPQYYLQALQEAHELNQ